MKKPFVLKCFSQTNERGVKTICGTVDVSGAWTKLSFVVEGALTSVVWPDREGNATFVRELWKETCFEIFLWDPLSSTYCEYNFSPSGNWACFEFEGYRKEIQRVGDSSTAPIIRTHKTSDRATVDIEFALRKKISKMRIGIGVVIDMKDQGHRFWALDHFSDKPDFHDSRSFLIET